METAHVKESSTGNRIVAFSVVGVAWLLASLGGLAYACVFAVDPKDIGGGLILAVLAGLGGFLFLAASSKNETITEYNTPIEIEDAD